MTQDSKAAYHALRQPADAWVHTSPDEQRKYQEEHKVSQTGWPGTCTRAPRR